MKLIRSLLLFALCLLAGTISCDEEAGTGGGGYGGGGYGGAAGLGGAAGSPFAGMGGAAGASVSDVYPPSCLQTLYSLCPAEGNCFFETRGGFRVSNYCYDSGVRFVLQYSFPEGGTCTEGDQTTTLAYTADGSLCYTEVVTTGPGCATSTVTWTDGQGNQVATGSTSRDELGTTTRVINCANGDSGSCEFGRTCIGFSCQEGSCT
jgi:hypothetical protein